MANKYRNYLTVKIPRGNDLVYLAGLFDGEGNYHKTQKGGWTWCLTNTNKDVMAYLEVIFGRKCTFDHSYLTRVSRTWTPAYRVRISGGFNILTLSKSLLPFLIIKRKKAQEVIRDIETKMKESGGRYGFASMA